MILMASVLLSRHSWQVLQLYLSSSDRKIPFCPLFLLSQQGDQVAIHCARPSPSRGAWSILECASRKEPELHSSSATTFSGAAGVVSTARIERPPFYRGGSASTDTPPAASPFPSEAARCASTKGGLVDRLPPGFFNNKMLKSMRPNQAGLPR